MDFWRGLSGDSIIYPHYLTMRKNFELRWIGLEIYFFLETSLVLLMLNDNQLIFKNELMLNLVQIR